MCREERGERSEVHVRESDRYGVGMDRKMFGIKPFQSFQGQRQCDTVLTAGNCNGDLITVIDHMIIIDRTAGVTV